MVKKILFLPLLRMSSGHHQVADALAEYALRFDPSIVCRKVDLLHFGFGSLESWIARAYLQWIRTAPNTYHWLYSRSVTSADRKRYSLYDRLFRPVLHKLVKTERPDLIVCTHALPSYLVQRMKEERELDVPTVNAYTDFFVNALWGTDGIDYHLAPDDVVRTVLIDRGVPAHRIFVTGIPVHPEITPGARTIFARARRPSVIVTGGHLGVAGLGKLIRRLPLTGQIHYIVFCGKNIALFRELKKMQHPLIEPIPFVSCRKMMNALYEQADAVLTKPGGVTVSECLRKRLPIFIYGALPGQETYNLFHLHAQRVVIDLTEKKRVVNKWEEWLGDFFSSLSGLAKWRNNADSYMENVREQHIETLFHHLLR